MYIKLQELFKLITKFLHLNKKISKYFIFLIVSLSFWFLTVMSKEYETTIFIPISYTDFPESKQLVNQLEKQIELKVKSYGFYLLSQNLFKTKPLIISINSLTETKTKNYSQKQWVVKRHYKKLYKLLSSDIKILSTTPDTLFVRFQQKKSKKVAVVFSGNLYFSSQYRLKDKIQLAPDSVFVFGTNESLSEINFIETDAVVFDKVEKGIKQDIDLSDINGISFSEKKVQISFEVEKFTEKIIALTLNPINVPKGYKIKFYPPKVEVVTTVAFADYDKLGPSFFVAEVDVNNLEEKNKLEVLLRKQPPFANVVKIKPSRVEFLLIKR
jgi:hypothetical protein